MSAYDKIKEIFLSGKSFADAVEAVTAAGEYEPAEIEAAQARLHGDIMARRV